MAKQTTKKVAVTAAPSFPKTEANRKARLARHLRKHPADTQTASAVGKPAPLRKKPQSKGMGKVTASHPRLGLGIGGTVSNADLKELVKATQMHFGKVKPNIFGCEYSRENVRALCYGVGIKFTGAANKPRRQPAKSKAK